jgi:hypothetical protein
MFGGADESSFIFNTMRVGGPDRGGGTVAGRLPGRSRSVPAPGTEERDIPIENYQAGSAEWPWKKLKDLPSCSIPAIASKWPRAFQSIDCCRFLRLRERLIMNLYYYEETTMKEIGLILGIAESRVSQMHASAVLHLRDRLCTPATSNVPASSHR